MLDVIRVALWLDVCLSSAYNIPYSACAKCTADLTPRDTVLPTGATYIIHIYTESARRSLSSRLPTRANCWPSVSADHILFACFDRLRQIERVHFKSRIYTTHKHVYYTTAQPPIKHTYSDGLARGSEYMSVYSWLSECMLMPNWDVPHYVCIYGIARECVRWSSSRVNIGIGVRCLGVCAHHQERRMYILNTWRNQGHSNRLPRDCLYMANVSVFSIYSWHQIIANMSRSYMHMRLKGLF